MKKFFKCAHCGNLVGVINDSGVPMICCGEPMKELIPNTMDAATEKHVPDVVVEGDLLKVTVGSTKHPMEKEHYIQFVFVETQKGEHMRVLTPGEEPYAEFNLHGDAPVAVYEHCNLHGLWKKDLTI